MECVLTYESSNTTIYVPCRHLDQAPLYATDERGEWTNVVIGWLCMDCGEQWFGVAYQ